QVFVWIANSQLLEKNIRHVEVVVLAGMHKDLPGAARGKCAIDRRQLHEIRASPYDVQKISTSFVSTLQAVLVGNHRSITGYCNTLAAGLLQEDGCAACDSIRHCKGRFGNLYQFEKRDWRGGAVPHSLNRQLQLSTVALIPLRFETPYCATPDQLERFEIMEARHRALTKYLVIFFRHAGIAICEVKQIRNGSVCKRDSHSQVVATVAMAVR